MPFKNFSLFLVTAILLALPLQADSATTVALYLTGSAQGDIKGDNRQPMQGSIECLQFETNVAMETAPRVDAIRVVKRIDRSSPLLLRAVVTREPMKAALFRFFRPQPTGDGTIINFYNISLANARILSIKQWVPNTIDPASANYPPQEIVTIGFERMIWSWPDGGISFEINVPALR